MYFNGVNGCMKTFDPKLPSIVDRMIMGNSISAGAKKLSFEKNRGILWSVNLIITRNDHSFSCPIIYTDTNSQCCFVHIHLNNA